MSQITSELLQSLAPATPKSKRDRFLPYLNEACPRYGIITEFQVAAFLATCMVESDHFRTTKEYKAKAGTKAAKAQSHYWPSGYYGRGLIQLTHEDNYSAFQDDVGDDAGIDVVEHPETVEDPRWAVEVSCWFWKKNRLNTYADQGIRGFHGLEGVVNTGRPTGQAWGYPERLAAYELARRIMPDDFKLGPDAPEIETDPESTSEEASTTPAGPTVEVNTEAATLVTQPSAPAPDPEPVTVKSVATGLWTKIMAGFTAITGLGINFSNVVESKLDSLTLNQIIFAIIGLALVVLSIYYYKTRQEAADEKTKLLINHAASTTSNTVALVK